jgi:tetratricopeptide (TPR) repeat protein
MSQFSFKPVRIKLQEGDVVLIGSDGRDDINLTPKSEKDSINEDMNLFLQVVERNKGNLELIVEDLMKMGELTDDLSILRLGYGEKELHTQLDCDKVFKRIIKLHVESLVRNRQYKDALELLQISPEKMSPTMLFFRGYCHAHLGRYHRALKYLEMALSREPNNARALKYAGLCNYYMKSYIKCQKYWEKSLHFNPSDKELEMKLQKLNLRISEQRSLLGKKQVSE